MPNATGRPPAIVIIARHGARLDAADKQWHLTSPTPYDPPLTYGGWTQSRALGARIASVLQAREKLQAQNTMHTNGVEGIQDGAGGESESPRHGRTKRRKHRVIIHTSPFLRCVQTSIAIAAGMAQYHGNHQPQHHVHHQSTKPSHLHSQLNHGGSPVPPPLSAIPEPDTEPSFRAAKQTKGPKQRKFRKPVIRVDAILGEWLTPDYFETITPPPSSVTMVAAAKAELLRPGDYSEFATEVRASKGVHGFPGGWGSLTIGTGPVPGDGPLSSMSNLGQALQENGRSSSTDSAHSGNGPSGNQTGYQPPSLAYAISPADPIPAGFVAHARDACVEVDYQWDSTSEPQNWGDGGEYGEEWAAMHKRFRKGLDHLLSWYRDRGPPKLESENAGKNGPNQSVTPQGDDDLANDNIDIVVILVTHGAGCNALIGALTNQPVLLDVGMASLTMAVRKDFANPPPLVKEQITPVPSIARSHGFSKDYNVKLIASTEHLRAQSNSLVIPQLQIGSPNLSSYSPQFRNSYGIGGGSPVESSFSIGESATRSAPVGNGSTRRSSITSSPRIPSRVFSSSPSSSLGGLWSRPTASRETSEEELSEGILLNFEDSGDSERGGKEMKEEGGKKGQAGGTGGRRQSQSGLWGGGPPMMSGEKERDRDKKRRWTMNEH